MITDTYKAYRSNGAEEEIGRVILDEEEWIILLQNITNNDIINIDTGSSLSVQEVEWIDTNFCVPLCKNDNFVKRYGLDTNMVSILMEGKGDIYLRLWLAEKGINSSLNNVINDLFPGQLPVDVLRNFWEWWQKMPLEPQAVGKILVSKNRQEFGIGHIHAWIKETMGGDEPKAANDRYIFNIKPWMMAYELYVLWVDGELISNDDGKLLPRQK